MRHKTNEFLKRLQLARPEVKKNFRRGGTNAAGMLRPIVFLPLIVPSSVTSR